MTHLLSIEDLRVSLGGDGRLTEVLHGVSQSLGARLLPLSASRVRASR